MAVHLTLVATTEQRARGGVLAGRGWALESAVARVCREAGGASHHKCDDQRLGPDPTRRGGCPETGSGGDGLPLFCGAQMAVDATLVSAIRSNGTARRRADRIDGVALWEARRRMERTYPELMGRDRRARLVVLGRRSRGSVVARDATQLARAKARGVTNLMRRRAEQAWRLRWGSILACAVARTVASTMLELPDARGADGDTPASQDVEQDGGFAGLAR